MLNILDVVKVQIHFWDYKAIMGFNIIRWWKRFTNKFYIFELLFILVYLHFICGFMLVSSIVFVHFVFVCKFCLHICNNFISHDNPRYSNVPWRSKLLFDLIIFQNQRWIKLIKVTWVVFFFFKPSKYNQHKWITLAKLISV